MRGREAGAPCPHCPSPRRGSDEAEINAFFFSFQLPFFSFPPPKLLPGWSYRYPCQKLTQNRRKPPLIPDKSWGNRWVFEPSRAYGTFQSRWGKKKSMNAEWEQFVAAPTWSVLPPAAPSLLILTPYGCTLFRSCGSFYHRCRLWFLPPFTCIYIYFFYFCTINYRLHFAAPTSFSGSLPLKMSNYCCRLVNFFFHRRRKSAGNKTRHLSRSVSLRELEDVLSTCLCKKRNFPPKKKLNFHATSSWHLIPETISALTISKLLYFFGVKHLPSN